MALRIGPSISKLGASSFSWETRSNFNSPRIFDACSKKIVVVQKAVPVFYNAATLGLVERASLVTVPEEHPLFMSISRRDARKAAALAGILAVCSPLTSRFSALHHVLPPPYPVLAGPRR